MLFCLQFFFVFYLQFRVLIFFIAFQLSTLFSSGVVVVGGGGGGGDVAVVCCRLMFCRHAVSVCLLYFIYIYLFLPFFFNNSRYVVVVWLLHRVFLSGCTVIFPTHHYNSREMKS